MLKYVILGIFQGLTEFLPVSSSGHLVIIQKILGINQQQLALVIALHLGTVVSLVIFFFKDILKALRDIKILALIIVVTVITGIIGISGEHFFEGLFSAPQPVAIALIFTGIMLILTKKITYAKRNILGTKDALVLGLAQGIAIVPGISRTGITISTLLFRGISKETAFRFSFLASIPAVLGAAIFKAKDVGSICQDNLLNLMLGFIFSLLTGLVALRLLKIVLRKARFHYFGYYCILVAIMTLLFIK